MAHFVNEARQKAIEAKAALNKLHDEHSSARSALSELLGRQIKGADSDAERKALGQAVTEAEGRVAGVETRVSAARKLEQLAAEELLAAEAKQAEEVKLAVKLPGSIVGAANADRDPRRGFASHRDYLTAVMKAHRGGKVDERLKALAVRDDEDEESGGQTVYMLPTAFTPGYLAAAGSDEQGAYSDPHGGVAVVTTRLPGLLQIGFEGDPTAGRTQPVPMQSPSVEMLARVDKNHTSSVSGGFTVTRSPETAAKSATRAKLELVTLKATSLFGVAYATEELLSDSPLSFVAVIDSGFRDQFAAHMLNEKLRGLGDSEFLGALNSDCLVTVAKEGAQPADTIVGQNVIKMRARSWGYGSGIWLANHDTLPQVVTLHIAGTHGDVFLFAPGNGVDKPDTLLGRPIFFTEFAGKLGDVGDIILGNWGQYLEGTYQPIQGAESMHVRFLNHERTFKFWVRNAGAPWWRSPLTPNKSGDTLSPFVTLAERA